MDHESEKVFVTGVKRNSFNLENNLYEIIQRDVAKPIISKKREDVQDITCTFIPSSGKFYVPKKKSKLKVSTVRDVRVVYEEDVLQTLPNELEKQQKLLLRKIKHGFSKDENTRSIAINLLKSNNPISRLSWQMLMNLNPEEKVHSSQYISWDGKCIRINGSKGGRNKFIFNYDICRGINKEVCRKTTSTGSKLLNKKRSLLRASLSVRFKPGPLSKKKHLDCSYQKHHVGEVKLVNLPKPGLHVQPTHGTPLEPTVKTFLQNLRENDGTISAKWAEFAVSMLGKVTNDVIHIENKKFITFNLNYKYNKAQFLMRQDLDILQDTIKDKLISREFSPCTLYDESRLTSEVRGVLDGIVDAVEISLNQSLMYPPFDELRDIPTTSKSEISIQAKEKPKRRYGELDRLDVTVIRLSESHKKNATEPCQQTFCTLGCICGSLECNYNLKDHCGCVDCMFKCKCDFSNYKITNSLDGDCAQLHPGLYYLDQKINGTLSKEEQKFHQTVILKDNKSILLKSNRRNWKATKKYEDFYNNLRSRSQIKNKKLLSVVVTKLNCGNVEPWCMVHNLYKCFCKGKFTESLTYDVSKNEQKQTTNEADEEKLLPRPGVSETKSVGLSITQNADTNTVHNADGPWTYICSRVLPYRGRNHGIKYYKATNRKIMEMEKNDIRLHAKMTSILNKFYATENTDVLNENNTKLNEITVEGYGNDTKVNEITEESYGNDMEASEIMEEVNEDTEKVIKKSAKVNKNTEEVNKSAKVNKNTEEVNKSAKVNKNTEEVNEKLAIVNKNTEEVNKKSAKVNKNTEEINEKLAIVNKNTEEVNKKSAKVNKNTEELNEKLAIVNKNTEEVNKKSSKVNKNTEEINEKLTIVNKNTEEVIKKSAKVNKNTDEANEKAAEVSEKTEDDGVKDLVDVANVPFKLDELLFNILQEQQKLMKSMRAGNKKADFSNDIDTIQTNRLPNKTKLVQWLETSYKKYKDKLDKGFWKTSLSPPGSGKVALYPWNFILSRYRERKNLFLISKQKPFRIFMAVDTRHNFFSKCVNVNLIPRSHLDNYPVMIRNLLNDVKDQNETFCILCGLSLCWELVGSVTKVNEKKRDESVPNNLEDSVDNSEKVIDRSEELVDHSKDLVDHSEDLVSPSNNESNLDNITTHIATDPNLNKHENTLVSNWFVMTIENDFVEIQFFKKGFFIKYDSIVRAIVVSRQYNKTVRLSSQKCNEGSSGPQFGLYAIPNMHDNCVFIGPYEKNEPLGIEALRKPVIIPSKNKTRGMWITVNKIDNAEVINNPLSFMPSFNNDQDQVITFGNDEYSDSGKHMTPSTSVDNQELASPNSEKKVIKECVKPVKINKADCFKFPFKILTRPLSYRCYKKEGKINLQRESPSDSSLKDDMIVLQKETHKKILESSKVTKESTVNEPLAKIPSQIKINNLASLLGMMPPSDKLETGKRPEKGMFVLKPEEINERLAFKYFSILKPDEINNSSTVLSTVGHDSVHEDSAAICPGGENSLDSATVRAVVEDPLDCPASSTSVENTLDCPASSTSVEDPLDCPASSTSVEDTLDSPPICLVDENTLESSTSYSVDKNSVDSSAICSPLATDVYIISDEEDADNLPFTKSWKDVWISCTNIKNLGWLPGIKNEENKISFKFPGFASTDYYDEEIAFNKINQVFTRKVYVPKNITMEWRVVENVKYINVEDELTLNYLNSDFVLTKQGLVHKNSLAFRGRKRSKEDTNLLGRKKKRIDDEYDYDNDDIEVEYIELPEDSVNPVLDDEQKNDDNDEVNNDVPFDDSKIQDEDKNLFEDKEKMDEYRKVFGYTSSIASMYKRSKQISTLVNKKEYFELDSAD